MWEAIAWCGALSTACWFVVAVILGVRLHAATYPRRRRSNQPLDLLASLGLVPSGSSLRVQPLGASGVRLDPR